MRMISEAKFCHLFLRTSEILKVFFLRSLQRQSQEHYFQEMPSIPTRDFITNFNINF